MPTNAAHSQKRKAERNEIIELRNDLVREKDHLVRLVLRIDTVLAGGPPNSKGLNRGGTKRNSSGAPAAPRSSPLDDLTNVRSGTMDLRAAGGNLSATKIASAYGISLSQLAAWLGRTKQVLSKRPEAESLQPALGYFERIARLRLVTEGNAEFREWLRMPNATLGSRRPIELLESGRWQALADKVDDMLTGAPT